ncbi:MAG: hypothetical protein ABIG43_04215 [Chloroflexota bacterium]
MFDRMFNRILSGALIRLVKLIWWWDDRKPLKQRLRHLTKRLRDWWWKMKLRRYSAGFDDGLWYGHNTLKKFNPKK